MLLLELTAVGSWINLVEGLFCIADVSERLECFTFCNRCSAIFGVHLQSQVLAGGVLSAFCWWSCSAECCGLHAGLYGLGVLTHTCLSKMLKVHAGCLVRNAGC